MFFGKESDYSQVQRSGARYTGILRVPVDKPAASIYDSDSDVPIDDPEVLREKQKAVDATEKRSARILGYEPDTDYWGVVNGEYLHQ